MVSPSQQEYSGVGSAFLYASFPPPPPAPARREPISEVPCTTLSCNNLLLCMIRQTQPQTRKDQCNNNGCFQLRPTVSGLGPSQPFLHVLYSTFPIPKVVRPARSSLGTCGFPGIGFLFHLHALGESCKDPSEGLPHCRNPRELECARILSQNPLSPHSPLPYS